MKMAFNPCIVDNEDTLMLAQILGNVHIIKSTFKEEHFDLDLDQMGTLLLSSH